MLDGRVWRVIFFRKAAAESIADRLLVGAYDANTWAVMPV